MAGRKAVLRRRLDPEIIKGVEGLLEAQCLASLNFQFIGDIADPGGHAPLILGRHICRGASGHANRLLALYKDELPTVLIIRVILLLPFRDTTTF